jgi:hypothetical protein
VSQNSQTRQLAITLPNVVFNVARVYPFKRKDAIGKQRWYEKIGLTYSAKLTNSVTTPEKEIFTMQTLKNMRNGVEHTLPISTTTGTTIFMTVASSYS